MLSRVATRLPTENQTKIVKALAPYIRSEALPWGLFARIGREIGVTDCYVAQIFERLREDDDRLTPLVEG